MIRTLIVSFLLLLTFAAMSSAQDGLALMRVEAGARPAGMGGAFTAVAGTPDAVLYNPAGAAGITEAAGSFGHTVYWDNIRLESGYFGIRVHPKWVLHAGIRYAAVDELERRSVIPSEQPTGLFDANDASFKIGTSYDVSPMLSVGASAGWFFEKIDEWSGWAFNVDLGARAQATERLALAAAVTALGSDFALSRSSYDASDDISLPTAYRAGATYVIDQYVVAADVVYLDDETRLHVGGEANLHELFQLRAGYMANYDTKNFTAGASFVQRNLTVDYAFVPYSDDLGTTHMFNLTFTL